MKTNLALIKYHNLSLSEIEDMYPWERLVYIDLIAQKVKEAAIDEIDKAHQMKDNQSLVRRR